MNINNNLNKYHKKEINNKFDSAKCKSIYSI